MASQRRPLASLRQHRRVLLRVLMPWLTAAWLSGTGMPCLEMSLAPAAATTPMAAELTHHHAADHAHAGSVHDHDEAAAPIPANHSTCPHCPPATADGASGAAAHARCGVLDDVASTTAPSKGTVTHAALLPIAVAGTSLSIDAPVGAGALAGAQRAPPPTTPLNIRHCIYLI